MRIGLSKPLAFVAAAAISLSAPPAPAQTGGEGAQPSAADKATAVVLFRDGRDLFEKGLFDEACPKLAESHRLEPKPGTILNVALCHEQQGKTATAWTEFMEAASLAGRAKQPAREKAARERIAAIEARLSKMTVDVKEPAPGIVVTLDDRPLAAATWTSAIPMDPGEHTIRASAPGRAPWTGTITIGPGPSTTTATVPPLVDEKAANAPPPPTPTAAPPSTAVIPPTSSAAPTAPPPAPTTAPAPPKSPPSAPPDAPSGGGLPPLFIGGVALGGVGVVGVVIGSIFGARTFSKKSEGDAHCNGELCTQEGLDIHAEAETSAAISTVAFGASIAALGAGTALVLIARGHPNPKAPAGPAARARLWIAPGGAPGPSLTAGGSF